ncbi:type III-B CRISPR module-associated Cmr3 family protein [Pseudodesulfovibrio sp.]|uniref:type III-B CRISPR module-associated Cmr3 family protein n=1 Tax=unclassified Pseudodesulfovibrio TaxID=2661612 RepID=UPI003B0012ED
MHWIALEQIDSWFFRTGRPMHLGETPVTKTESAFPPQAHTVVGALRASLARSNGWSGRSKWTQDIQDVLGSEQNLGKLQFMGPFLCLENQPVFPVPRHLLGRLQDLGNGQEPVWNPAALLAPGAPVRCDLAAGPVCLPQPVKCMPNENLDELKNIPDAYVTLAGMDAILRGQLPAPETILPASTIWLPESRIGIQRQPKERTTGADGLFSTVHIRLRKDVHMCMGVAGVPQEWIVPSGFIPFGGEGRVAALSDVQEIPLPQHVRPADGSSIALVFLTPVDFADAPLEPGKSLPGTEGLTLVSACLDRPLKLGGWCSIKHQPLALRPLLPAGSVLFCTAESRNLDSILLDTAIRLGQRTEYGFGLAAIGVWPTKEAHS